MKKEKKKPALRTGFENVRVPSNVLERVREYKKKTYLPITAFVVLAISEKLAREAKP